MEILAIVNPDQMIEGILGVFSIGVLVIFGIGMYILSSWIYWSIYTKSGHKDPWLAWVPIVNVIPMLQLGGFSGWLILLPIIPFVGGLAFLIIWIIALWRVFEKAGYPGGLSLLTLLPFVNIIMLAIVAWEKKEYPNVEKPS